jgi:hypothetical protein
MNFNVKSRCGRKLKYSCHPLQVLLSHHLFRNPRLEWLPGTSAGGGQPGTCPVAGLSLNKMGDRGPTPQP